MNQGPYGREPYALTAELRAQPCLKKLYQFDNYFQEIIIKTMDLKEFFSNTFFTVAIAISALIVSISYFRLVQGKLIQTYKRKKIDKIIANLFDHFIICGFGRVGRQIVEEFASEGIPFVVVDRRDYFSECFERKWPFILGDAAVDEGVLKKAGIDRAKGLIISVGQDADSVFIAVAAKSLNPNLFIVARASTKQAADKLRKVGVDRVALPYQIGGYHMATMAIRPAVVDFLDVIVDSKHSELQVEEILAKEGSKLIGKPLASYLSRKKTGAVVLAIKKESGESLINPTAEVIIERGDSLILMGTKEQLNRIGQEIK